MKKIICLFFVVIFFNSCSVIDSENTNGNEATEVPPVRSYVTYISQNSVTLNGVIDNTNNYYQGPGTYKVGFVFRTGSINDSSNDQFILVDQNVAYEPYKKYFNTTINSLQPNTTYYYTCFAENGSFKTDNWKEFTTSEIPCSQSQNNYVSISGVWRNVYPEINDPSCCDEGNFGIKFGTWPNIYEINFNELNNGYPKTGQYFGVDYYFDITEYNKEVVKSSNQVLIGNSSTTETDLFVVNDGITLTLIFCNMTLRDGSVLNGKVSVALP
ncbi:hypothetical protein [Flavobacterium sp. NRK F7]|uniref:hypothetical protein n=1 Tax=Flavobacterium sp. NRK F7 TaxID=2954930 RepID=UPI0020900B4A|nr:hypothetical protein [Flavobacterium sp. NRK F7]MCO6163668.1 hypothetical protein [Flavobacterium sp. NRK F7]